MREPMTWLRSLLPSPTRSVTSGNIPGDIRATISSLPPPSELLPRVQESPLRNGAKE
jgi:hypothetical protein